METETLASDASARETLMHILRQLRMAKGYTQTGLSKKLKLKAPSTVSQWESGENIPSAKLIPKLSKLLGLKARELTRLIANAEDEPAIGSVAK